MQLTCFCLPNEHWLDNRDKTETNPVKYLDKTKQNKTKNEVKAKSRTSHQYT